MANYITRKVTNKNYEGLLLLILLPIIGFSYYKYGYLEYTRGFINIITSLKVIWLLMINILITLGMSLFLKERYPYKYYEVTLLTLLMPIQIPYLVDIIGVIVYNLLRKCLNDCKLNNVAITKLIITVILISIGKYNYLSIYQEQVSSIYTASDLIWGATIGTIGSNNIVILLICYILLSNISVYKKDIPWYAMFGFSLALGIYGLINHNLVNLIKLTLNSPVLFSFIFVSAISISSPIGKKLRKIYGLLVGLLTFLFLQINPYEASIIAIIITNLIINLIDNYILK